MSSRPYYQTNQEHIDRACPFCNAASERILAKREEAYLTYALAPYARYHLLIIPIEHFETLLDLPASVQTDIQALLCLGMQVIKQLGIGSCCVLLREGKQIKSVDHLHYHLIPGLDLLPCEDLNNTTPYPFLRSEEIKQVSNEIRQILSSIEQE